MRQLVELRKNSDQFKEYGVEIICVFREEAKGVEGLKLIKDKTKVDFTLTLDRNKEKTGKYSPGRRKFDNYVIDKNGVICAIIDGSLRKRALAKQLLQALEEIETGKKKAEKKTEEKQIQFDEFVSGKINGGGPELKVETKTGDIQIRKQSATGLGAKIGDEWNAKS